MFEKKYSKRYFEENFEKINRGDSYLKKPSLWDKRNNYEKRIEKKNKKSVQTYDLYIYQKKIEKKNIEENFLWWEISGF